MGPLLASFSRVDQARNQPVEIACRDSRPFPLTESPAFALFVLTLLAWMVGIVVTLSNPQRFFGYGLCILTAIFGGLFSFLLWFAINGI